MRLRSLVLLAAAVVGGVLAAPAAASPPQARPYVVVLQDDVRHPSDVAAEHRRRHGAQVTRTYGAALKGYAASLTPAAHAEVLRDPRVAYVEPDGVVTASTVQSPAPWGLDRIDQKGLPLSGSYSYSDTSTAVVAYVVDSGIRYSHADFGGRASFGFDAFGGGGSDCNGHGTHVAGTIGGATHGVAKGVSLVAVRVLDCAGSGSWSGVVAGIDWIVGHHVGTAPAVANMSLGGGASRSVDDAVKRGIADGVSFAVAAGNDSSNACYTSPARVPEALTVAASTRADSRASYSNYGSCVDLFAPGSEIMSAWSTGDDATRTSSGTSMAAPHVAGVAALHLTQNPGSTPAVVASSIVAAATPNVLTSTAGSPNRLLFDVVPVVQPTTSTTSKGRK